MCFYANLSLLRFLVLKQWARPKIQRDLFSHGMTIEMCDEPIVMAKQAF
jgi:hypothetical protein